MIDVTRGLLSIYEGNVNLKGGYPTSSLLTSRFAGRLQEWESYLTPVFML